MSAQFSTKRLGKELQKVRGRSSSPALRSSDKPRLQISNSLPPGIELVSAENFEEWLLDIKVLDNNPLYLNETYRLKFRFSSTYPIGRFPCPAHTPKGGDGPGLPIWCCADPKLLDLQSRPRSSSSSFPTGQSRSTHTSTRMASFASTSWGSRAGPRCRTSRVSA